MKANFLVIPILFLLFYSCCGKEPEPVAVIRIHYQNVIESQYVTAVPCEKGNIYNRLDTIQIGSLSELNNYTILLDVTDNSSDYLLQVEGSNQTDTITDIHTTWKEGRCNRALKDFSYKHNGESRSDANLTITL